MHVLVPTRDLVFRAKLGAVVRAAGGDLVADDAACDIAVVDAAAPGAVDRIRGLVARGVPVVAYGPHVDAGVLRAARAAGATAVPNSEVERVLAERLRA